jgi:hypothetical protein
VTGRDAISVNCEIEEEIRRLARSRVGLREFSRGKRAQGSEAVNAAVPDPELDRPTVVEHDAVAFKVERLFATWRRSATSGNGNGERKCGCRGGRTPKVHGHAVSFDG